MPAAASAAKRTLQLAFVVVVVVMAVVVVMVGGGRGLTERAFKSFCCSVSIIESIVCRSFRSHTKCSSSQTIDVTQIAAMHTELTMTSELSELSGTSKDRGTCHATVTHQSTAGSVE